MTVFNLDKDEQGDWFAFFESHIDQSTGELIYAEPEEGAAEFRVRSMVPFWEEKQRLRKREHKMMVNPKTRAMERVGYYEDLPPDQQKKETEDAWDYAITGIKDAFSSDGSPIECTKENKLKLIEVPMFLRFVSRVFEIIDEAGIKRKEEAEKNS